MRSGKIIEPLIHIFVWMVLYILAMLFIRTIGPFNRLDNTLFLPLTIGTIFNAFIFYSISFFLIPRYANKSHMKEFVVGIFIVFMGCTLLETLIDHFFLVWLYSDSPETFFSMFLTNTVVHAFFASIGIGYGFTRTWVINEKKKQELIHEKLTAELNFLKTQLNPHFLFNVLNMAYSSANRKGDEQTADIIEKLSVLLRYMLYESNVDKIEVGREIDFIKNYINLQKMRLSADIPANITFTINGDYSGYRIAPLILIPFVENAFKHGIKLEQPSAISMTMNFQNHEMEFVTRNPAFNNSKGESKNSGIGIKNTQKRLSILYAKKHQLEIDNNGKEFQVKLRLILD